MHGRSPVMEEGKRNSHFRRAYLILLSLLVVAGYSQGSAEEPTNDSALWTGALFLVKQDKGLDYSIEYQVRLDENASALSSHFVEFMGYRKVSKLLLLNGGYRFTMRPDHNDHRLYVGGFLDLTGGGRVGGSDPRRFLATLQIGYQHDFNAKFDDRLMGSNSIRFDAFLSDQNRYRTTQHLSS